MSTFKVTINLYDIQRTCNQKGADRFGLGIYHSGVEVNGMEFAFGGNSTVRTTGVYQIEPRSHSNFEFKYSIELGELDPKDFDCQKISFDDHVWPILVTLMDKYAANNYDLLSMNCNHFSNEFINMLFKNKKKLPNFINRAAYLGSWFKCFVPKRYLIVTPPGLEEEAAALAEQIKLEESLVRSTRETEMSIGSSSSSRPGRKSGLIDSFYHSLSSRKGDDQDDPSITSDDEEDEEFPTGHREASDSDADSTNLVARARSSSPKKRQGGVNLNETSDTVADRGESSPQAKSRASNGYFSRVNPYRYYRYFMGAEVQN